MKRQIAEYVDKCMTYQKVKVEHQHLGGELRPLKFPHGSRIQSHWTLSWDYTLSISKKESLGVIVDRLTKSSHFIAIHNSWEVERVAQLYVKEIIRLHRIPKHVVYDKDKRFQALCWRAL